MFLSDPTFVRVRKVLLTIILWHTVFITISFCNFVHPIFGHNDYHTECCNSQVLISMRIRSLAAIYYWVECIRIDQEQDDRLVKTTSNRSISEEPWAIKHQPLDVYLAISSLIKWCTLYDCMEITHIKYIRSTDEKNYHWYLAPLVWFLYQLIGTSLREHCSQW